MRHNLINGLTIPKPCIKTKQRFAFASIVLITSRPSVGLKDISQELVLLNRQKPTSTRNGRRNNVNSHQYVWDDAAASLNDAIVVYAPAYNGLRDFQEQRGIKCDH